MSDTIKIKLELDLNEEDFAFLAFLMEEGYEPDEIAKALWLLEDDYDCLEEAESKEESDAIHDEIADSQLELEELFTRYQEVLHPKTDMAGAFRGVYDFYCNLERLKGTSPMYAVRDDFWALYMNAEDGE